MVDKAILAPIGRREDKAGNVVVATNRLSYLSKKQIVPNVLSQPMLISSFMKDGNPILRNSVSSQFRRTKVKNSYNK